MTDKVRILIGMGTCGLAAGAQAVYDAVVENLKSLNIEADIISTGCVGYCQKEVIVDIQKPGFPKLSYGDVTANNVEELLKSVLVDGKNNTSLIIGKYRAENEVDKEDLSEITYIDELPFFKKQRRLVLKNCGHINPKSIDEYLNVEGFAGLKKAFAVKSIDVINEVKKSGLRGRGGGGFPTGMKWEFAYNAQGDKKYMVCNADEGDPGAFMDRSVLEGDPFALIEGMTIAAYAIGANYGYIYARAEYPLAIEHLEYAIKIAKEKNLLGENILGSGFNFDLKIKKGAGAFVCGEETALIASIEGKRGMPRPRPPFPAIKGVFGCPTVINNVETLANIPGILRNGGDWFASVGTEKSKGTKVFALTGKINNTGLVEVPMGITLREIINDIGGGITNNKKYKAVQIGGPSGGCIPTQHLDIKIDYESLKEVGAMMGSGGLVVMDETTCMVDVAKFFLEFITKESCGKCIPCREGTMRMYEILKRITTSRENLSEEENLERFKGVVYLNSLAEVIRDTSLCGLGQTAPNPVLSTLKYFRDEYDAHIYDRKCPSGYCKSLLTYSIDTGTCIGCGLCKRKCSSEAIVGEPKKAHYIISDKCAKCDQCRQACPVGAIVAQ
ncbi:MAG: NADH dehydrogenase [Candidatus Melainabacteria bacterium RIFOXYA12_FULL_32_12]|nr:MAG: NADH dehydrogenase [Candidatus Melainabacteria bacterium RIFOXYA2_FULL_32_9]OGI27693.1 MAG: NADH dehydrogenase [Candidatus Melainabacteria bacterium RIFOXYA12_FULL_32_12]